MDPTWSMTCLMPSFEGCMTCQAWTRALVLAEATACMLLDNTRSGGPAIFAIPHVQCTSSCENCFGVLVWNFCEFLIVSYVFVILRWAVDSGVLQNAAKQCKTSKYRKICRELLLWHVTCCDLWIRCEWAFARLTPRRWASSAVEQQASMSMRNRCIMQYISNIDVYRLNRIGFDQTLPMMCILVQLRACACLSWKQAIMVKALVDSGSTDVDARLRSWQSWQWQSVIDPPSSRI